jgi:biopolymer transport protein TolQ
MFENSTIYNLIAQSDEVTKLVLLILLFMSLISWSIFFYKLILLRIKRGQIKSFMKKIRNIETFDNLMEILKNNSKNYIASFLSKIILNVKELVILRNNNELDYVKTKGLENLQYLTEQNVFEFVEKEESYISFLSVSVSISPLLGLFGTIWGLIHAFIRISEKQSADIVTVAPGVAEALITTIAGLFVAIPALVLFYYINTRIKKIENLLFEVSSKVLVVSKKLFFKIENKNTNNINNLNNNNSLNNNLSNKNNINNIKSNINNDNEKNKINNEYDYENNENDNDEEFDED